MHLAQRMYLFAEWDFAENILKIFRGINNIALRMLEFLLQHKFDRKTNMILNLIDMNNKLS